MKVNDKPTGMNNPGAVGMQTTRDQSPHVRPFLSWRFGHENISMNFFPLLLIQKELSFQLMSKECKVRTGKLRPRRLLMIKMAMITDHRVKERTSREITL